MKVALYTRVSTEEQAKYGLSVDAQKQALIQYCKDNKYTYDVYCDEGISASSMKRPDLNNMLNNVSKYKMILFTKLDRLSRNVLDANIINNKLKEHNCSMKAIFEDDVDTSTADGKFIFDLKISLAERELGKTSERIKSVFDYKVKVLKTVISGAKKYGYDIVDKKYQISENEAENIKNAYNNFISCGSLRKTFLQWTNDTGLIDYSNFRTIMSNKNYIGIYTYNNEEIEDYIPRIMDDELFYKVQSLLSNNKKAFTKSDNNYILNGIAYCGVCGRKMVCMTNNSKTKYYRCSSNVHHHKCNNNKYFNEKNLINEILLQLPILVKEYNLNEKKTTTKKVVDNTPKIKEKIKRLQELYIDGMIEKNLYNQKYSSLSQELAEEKEKLKETKTIDNTKLSKVITGKYIDMYNKLDEDHKSMFFRNIIDKVELYDDRTLKITLKVYKVR